MIVTHRLVFEGPKVFGAVEYSFVRERFRAPKDLAWVESMTPEELFDLINKEGWKYSWEDLRAERS